MAYIDQHKPRFGVEPICDALRAEGIAVAPSGYYAHKSRPPSRRALSDAALAEVIEATFWDREKGRGVYRARKMVAQLRRWPWRDQWLEQLPQPVIDHPLLSRPRHDQR